MTIRTKTIGRLPQNKSEWDPNYVNPDTGQRGYGQKFRVYRYGCELESKIENNTYDPFDWDGDQNFVLDVAHWELCSGNPKVWAAGNPKPAASEEYPYNGMGRVVIPKNMQNIAEEGEPENIVNLLTQEAFEDGEGNPLTNTVYVIQYDFALGDDITVPANCVLEFDGGTIDGSNTITFQNTEITGTKNGITHNVGLAGTIKGIVDVGFWDLKTNDSTYDNGVVINKVASVFKSIYIPKYKLYFSTPINMGDMNKIDCDASLFYNGIQTNVASIKIHTSRGVFTFNDMIVCDSSVIDHTEANNSKIRGLEFDNVGGSAISFVDIRYFNEGLRVSCTDSNIGSSYNTFNLGGIFNCDFGLRIYQANGGWCNQNIFIGGRITYFTGWDYSNPTWCVFCYGAKYEGGSDSYDSVNNLTFIGTCVEDYYGFYLRNVQYSKIIGTRHEGSTHPLKLAGGSCSGIQWEPSYPGSNIDVTENNNTGLSPIGQNPFITETIKPSSGSVTVEIDTTVYRAFTANLFKSGRVLINYLEDTNGLLDTPEKKKAYPKMGWYFFDMNGILDPGANGMGLGDYIFFVPEGITKISIEFWNNVGGTLKLYDL